MQTSTSPPTPRIFLRIGAGLVVVYALVRGTGWWSPALDQERPSAAASPGHLTMGLPLSPARDDRRHTQAAAPALLPATDRHAVCEAPKADGTDLADTSLAEAPAADTVSWESVRPELFQTLRDQLASKLGGQFTYNSGWLRGGIQKLAWRTVLALEAQPYGAPAPSYTQMLQQLEAQLASVFPADDSYRRALEALLERKLEGGEFEVRPPASAERKPQSSPSNGPGKSLMRLFATQSDWWITVNIWPGEDPEVDAARPNPALALRACLSRALAASGHVLPEAEFEKLLADRGPGPKWR